MSRRLAVLGIFPGPRLPHLVRSGLMLVIVFVLGCSDAPRGGAGDGSGSGPSRGEDVELTVFAAASLSSAFRSLSEAYGKGEGGSPVLLNLAGSQTLAAQILEGAPADLFASANEAQMRRVAEAGMVVEGPVTIARNVLAIAVEPGNPRGISGLRDLARPDLAVVLGAPGVPVGDYARRALEEAGVEVRPASLETDVKQVVAKIALGEADAGIVYQTDLHSAGDAVQGIPIRREVNQVARYRMAVLTTSVHPAVAGRFLDFLTSGEGREILRRHGFRAPDPEGYHEGTSGGEIPRPRGTETSRGRPGCS